MGTKQNRLRRRLRAAQQEVERLNSVLKIEIEHEKEALDAWRNETMRAMELQRLKHPRLCLFGWRIWS